MSQQSLVRTKMEEFSIIPDMIGQEFENKVELHIMYGQHAVHCGNLIPWKVTFEPPVILSMHGVNEHMFYTLVLVDLDAPSERNPAFREWRHWILADIPGCDILRGKEISAYSPAEPDADTGIHRYVFMLFQQKEALNLEQLPDMGAKRGWFKSQKFAEEHNLTPVGCNFFRAHHMVHSDSIDIDMRRIVEGQDTGVPDPRVY